MSIPEPKGTNNVSQRIFSKELGRFAELAIENLRRCVAGAALLNRVDGGQEY